MEWYWWLAIAVGIISLLALAVRKGWVDLSDKTNRRGGSLGGGLLLMDEVFAPTRHEAQSEIDQKSRLPKMNESPNLGPLQNTLEAGDVGEVNRFGGRIRLSP